jgi:hypothetical protein
LAWKTSCGIEGDAVTTVTDGLRHEGGCWVGEWDLDATVWFVRIGDNGNNDAKLKKKKLK